MHTHFILNSVSFEDGHKFQQKSTELQEMKDLSDKICLEHGLSLTQKGRTFDGKEREETTAYKKEQYRLLQRAEHGEVKSYVQDIALAVMDCREQANSREHFIELMNANGYDVVWTDNRKYITFTDLARKKQDEKQCKIRNSKLEKYYHTDFSKEGLESEFADNARKQQEVRKQAVKANTIAQHGRVAILDTRTVLKESGAVLDQSEAISGKLRLDRDDTRTTLRRADIKVKSSTASRVDREIERERLGMEESKRLTEQAEREREALAERSKKKSRGGFER
ncbi:MAG: relaxase/mobilization nuclease domain-containing protein [Ruminococcus sp.]|nr:relaxase/mobilization nuclease domain-containing protein [Ruminococcus sp.]